MKSSRFLVSAFVLPALGFFAGVTDVPQATRARPEQFAIQELPVSAALPFCSPVRISSTGLIVGQCSSIEGPGEAFIVRWQKGKINVVGFGYVRAVNRAGEMVGQTFWWSGGGWQPLDKISKGIATLSGINDSSTVTGTILDAQGLEHAFLYDGKRTELLGNLGGDGSNAYDINGKSQVVGWSYTTDHKEMRAALWDHGHAVNLGAFPGTAQSTATRVTDSGQVVGYCSGERNGGGFLWEHGQMLRLPVPPGYDTTIPSDINRDGVIAGYCSKPAQPGSTELDGGRHPTRAAILCTRNKIVDLTKLLPRDSGWTLLYANSINDSYQIVGIGFHNGKKRPYVMKSVVSVRNLSLGIR